MVKMWLTVAVAVILAYYLVDGHNHSDHSGHDHDHDHSSHGSNDKVALAIYYESLCPDSIKFFKEQMTPANYEAFKNFTTFQWVPFGPVGKAVQWYDNGFQFKCQHGENECYGNIVQACAIRELQDNDDRYHVISCLMTALEDPKKVTNKTYPTEMCLKRYDLEQTRLDNCIHGTDGLIMLSKMGNLTADVKPKVDGVPTVTVNMVVNKEATTNLKSVLCSELKSKNLKACVSAGNVFSSSVLLMAVASLLRAFIVS